MSTNSARAFAKHLHLTLFIGMVSINQLSSNKDDDGDRRHHHVAKRYKSVFAFAQ